MKILNKEEIKSTVEKFAKDFSLTNLSAGEFIEVGGIPTYVSSDSQTKLEILAKEAKTGIRKGQNICFIHSTSNKTEEDKTTMYLVHFDKAMVQALEEATDCGTLLTAIMGKSKDMKENFAAAGFAIVEKFSKPRTLVTKTADQNSFFSIVIHTYASVK